MSSSPLHKSPPGTTRQTNVSKSDLGNTDYFEAIYGDSIRYDQSRKRWLVWHEHRWEPDAKKRVEEAAQTAARKRSAEAFAMSTIDPITGQSTTELEEKRTKAVAWALHSESRNRIESVLSLAQKRTGISVTTAEGWDDDPWLMGVPNGVIDLRNGTLRAGRQDDRITMHAGVKFNATASCPRWEQFLDEVLGGDQELVTFTRRAIGYTATGDVREDCWFGCFGEGRNGKSTLFMALAKILGDYHYAAPISLVEGGGKGEGGRKDFDLVYLQSKRLVEASETREGAVWDEERLKKLSGGDPLHAEIKHGASFNFWPNHKLWFMFNHQPRVRDHSAGFWRRVRLIPFLQKFEGSTDDKLLDKKLEAEYEGILVWIVKACIEWQQYGLTTPSAVLAASKQYEDDSDPLGEFIRRRVDMSGPGFYLTDAFALYTQWTKDEHILNALGRTRFSTLLESRGFKRGKRGSGGRPYFENGTLVHTCICMSQPCQCVGAKSP